MSQKVERPSERKGEVSREVLMVSFGKRHFGKDFTGQVRDRRTDDIIYVG